MAGCCSLVVWLGGSGRSVALGVRGMVRTISFPLSPTCNGAYISSLTFTLAPKIFFLHQTISRLLVNRFSSGLVEEFPY